MGRLESSIENSFNTQASKFFFLSVKLIADGNNGFPDRTVFGLGCHIFFVELKKFGKEPRPDQITWHKRLRKIGFRVYVCDTVEGAIEIFTIEKGLQNAKEIKTKEKHAKKKFPKRR